MRAILRSWRKQIKQRQVTTLVVATILVIASALIIIEVKSYGAGFAGKTLWDWLNLLGVLAIPTVVGLGTIWFTRQQAKVSDTENKDNQCEAALQDYINKMSELLLDRKLRESTEDAEVRTIARVRTLTVLARLDPIRKKSILQFLHESGLVNKNKPVIDLSGAYFMGADLNNGDFSNAKLSVALFRGADLFGVNFNMADLNCAELSQTDLRKAKLRGADLGGAILFGADLSEADLSGANLSWTQFNDANLSNANLKGARGVIPEKLEQQAASLKGTIMPDGLPHP